MTPMQELCAMRDERDAAIRERDEADATIEMMRTTISDSDARIVELTLRCDQTRHERDTALAAAKSQRWTAVFGCTVAVHVNEYVRDIRDEEMRCITQRASRIADQVEEMWEKNRETKA